MNRNFLFLILSCFVFLCACGTLSQPREKFTVSLKSPQVPIGEAELQFDRFMTFGRLKKESVEVIYFPREDAVCLKYRREMTTYHQFWSYSGRQTFITALERYNRDYNERNLITKNRKTIREYGVVEGYLIWQMFSFTVQAQGNMNVQMGYQFRDDAPYFSVNQREAEYKEEMSRDNNRTSTAVTMYFTRAQAAELAALFDQSYLRTLALPSNTVSDNMTEELPSDRDVY